MALSPQRIDELARRVAELLPAGVGQFRSELEDNLRDALGAALARMDLVTREEFDVQAAVLARTREKLARLERQVAALEAQPAAQDAAPPSGGED